MEVVRKENVTCISYNCSYANDVKLPFLKELFEQCDFLMLQEHGLYKSQFQWFDNIQNGIGKHGESAMDENQLLRGRPHGGVAILWNPKLKSKITPISCSSPRLCAVSAEFDSQKVLIICVYMPCDDRCHDQNIVEYSQILNDIEILCNSINVDSVWIGGDFNTDLSRMNMQTNTLNNFTLRNNFSYCAQDICCNINYTYCSRGTGATSFIDHFIIGENALDKLLLFESVESINDCSDHVPIKCVIENKVLYRSEADSSNNDVQYGPSWIRATDTDKARYKATVDEKLQSVFVPYEAIMCSDMFCNIHLNQISDYYIKIVDILISSAIECISVGGPVLAKKVLGWNEYVKSYFKSALFWHFLWKENGQPAEGILAEIRRRTRSQYHQAHKMVLKHEGEIKMDKIEKAFDSHLEDKAWQAIKKTNSKSIKNPIHVDDVTGNQNIAELFANNFKGLFNEVGYDENDITSLKNVINDRIFEGCRCHTCSQGYNCIITSTDVEKAVNRLQNDKRDGYSNLLSNNIIEAGPRLHTHLSLLLSSMVGHGLSPDDMLWSTMVPVPKGKWANLSSSANYRAIALSSIVGKLLDLIILEKEEKQLVTSPMQFGFKKGASTSLCTSMVQETVSYFVHKKNNVYGLLLDASKAFDRISYVKLFHGLLSRNVCPFICRLLLNMYTSQKLRVRWSGTHSECFSVSNGVKQGGVISPILFCVYMDDLLMRLQNSGVGCYMGGVFSGAFAYADDLTLLCPSLGALRQMITICAQYATEYDIKFNASKSQLIVFKGRRNDFPIPEINLNGDAISVVNSIVHLGHIINDNIFKYDVSKCVSDFNRQCNMFLSNFKNAKSHFKNFLFHKYCSSFYGTQIYPLYDSSLSVVFKAWRMAIRRVWRVPWRTHCNMLPHLAGVLPPELWFCARAINFLNLGIKSNNIYVKTVMNMGLYGAYSVIGGNLRLLEYRYNMNIKEMYKNWSATCQSESEVIRLVEQVKELCDLRDRNVSEFTNKEICDIIEFLCIH